MAFVGLDQPAFRFETGMGRPVIPRDTGDFMGLFSKSNKAEPPAIEEGEEPGKLVIDPESVKKFMEIEQEAKDALPVIPDRQHPMMTSMSQVQLGARYRDMVSGFVGIATARSEELTGCDRLRLSSQDKKNPSSVSLDVTCADYIDEGVSATFGKMQLAAAGASPGGPMELEAYGA